MSTNDNLPLPLAAGFALGSWTIGCQGYLGTEKWE